MVVWLFFLVLNSYSQTLERFCLSSVEKKSEVIKSLTPLLLPSDKFSSEGNCFDLSTASHRRELLQSYILKLDPSASVDFSSEEIRRNPCRLKVEKIRHQTGSETNVSLNSASARQIKTKGTEISKIQTLSDFELALDQNVIRGNCRFITPRRYEIGLEVRKDPKPLYPPASPGVIILINGNPPPPQKTSKLKTTIQLSRGEKIHLGSVNQDEAGEKKQLDLRPRVGFGESEKKRSEEIYLSID